MCVCVCVCVQSMIDADLLLPEPLQRLTHTQFKSYQVSLSSLCVVQYIEVVCTVVVFFRSGI